ncbi:hypothetical protein [Curtobacterium sp. MCPF17_052]|nr:hypothetical protein [Curtobacterium sp. MCPF17_052]WIB12383.1 hypothetical protein DEJ36_17120 [Curtobacterium sp. MCPF17_052]
MKPPPHAAVCSRQVNQYTAPMRFVSGWSIEKVSREYRAGSTG